MDLKKDQDQNAEVTQESSHFKPFKEIKMLRKLKIKKVLVPCLS
jgi:hypothetical protein